MPESKIGIFNIAGVDAREYAARWGCSPSCDRHPNVAGDGEMFYRFSDRTAKTPEWLERFVCAIDRTIAAAAAHAPDDRKGLALLRLYVQDLIDEGKSVAQQPEQFIKGYMHAALFTSSDEVDGGERCFDEVFTLADVHRSTIDRMRADCKAFMQENAELLADPRIQAYTAGCDFWYTRCRHGTGFWDRDLGDVGAALTAAAHRFKEVHLYVGDDGKIHAQ